MKKYKKKPEHVEALQCDGTWESVSELRKYIGNDIWQTETGVYCLGIKILKGQWIVRDEDGDIMILRDDQFKEAYEEVI